MDFKMADTSERRVFCNTILLKYHALLQDFYIIRNSAVSYMIVSREIKYNKWSYMLYYLKQLRGTISDFYHNLFLMSPYSFSNVLFFFFVIFFGNLTACLIVERWV